MAKMMASSSDNASSAAATSDAKGPDPRPTFRERIFDGNLGGYVLLLPAIIILAALTLWPLVFSVGISFTDYPARAAEPLSFVGLDNYVRIANDVIFVDSVVTTIKVFLIIIPLQLALGYLCARVFQAAHGMMGVRIFRTLFILPTMMTALSVALFWRYIFDPVMGIANYLLTSIGLPMQLFLADPGSALYVVIFIFLWQWVPFTTLIVLAGLLAIPSSIYEAAAIDGARWYHRILWIDLPLLRRVLAIGGILATVEVLRIFDLVYGATQGGPGTTTFTVTYGIFRTAFNDFNTAEAAAQSLLVLVMTILIAQLFVRLLKEEK